jgi:hypothetical protein
MVTEPDHPERPKAAKHWAEGIQTAAAVLAAIATIIRALRG